MNRRLCCSAIVVKKYYHHHHPPLGWVTWNSPSNSLNSLMIVSCRWLPRLSLLWLRYRPPPSPPSYPLVFLRVIYNATVLCCCIPAFPMRCCSCIGRPEIGHKSLKTCWKCNSYKTLYRYVTQFSKAVRLQNTAIQSLLQALSLAVDAPPFGNKSAFKSMLFFISCFTDTNTVPIGCLLCTFCSENCNISTRCSGHIHQVGSLIRSFATARHSSLQWT